MFVRPMQPANAVSAFLKEYERVKNMPSMELNKEYDLARIEMDVWKYHEFPAHRKSVENNLFYKYNRQYSKYFDTLMYRKNQYQVFNMLSQQEQEQIDKEEQRLEEEQ